MAPLLSLFTCLLSAAGYFLQLLLWLVHDPVSPTMAVWQPHLGAREGLEPLGSDLEGSKMAGNHPLDNLSWFKTP